MKKIFFLLLFLLLSININNIFADNNCETNELYPLYKCRNENICEEYKPKIILYDSTKDDDYMKIPDNKILRGFMLPNARDKYINRMNSIYVCATLKIEMSAVNEIISSLVKLNKDIDSEIGGKFKEMQNNVKKKFKEYKCKGANKKGTYNKLNVLKQSTWEMCKYRNYLGYLSELNVYLDTLLKDDKTISNTILVDLKRIKDSEIDKEINHIYKVYPAAFQAYSSYENNYIIHLYLKLIKADFIVLRRKIHEGLGPINQVVYKILNAMSL